MICVSRLRRIGRAIAIYAISIALTLVAVYAVLCIPRHIQREFPAIEYQMGLEVPEIIQSMNIRIDGWLENRPFVLPHFKGTFEISAYAQTMDSHVDVFLSKSFAQGGMTYFGAGTLTLFGVLYTDRDFSSVVVNLCEDMPGADGSTITTNGDKVIVAPAANLEQVSDVLGQRKVFWMQDFTGILYMPEY